jgi:tetratricopeptide (TPR) repeat protein
LRHKPTGLVTLRMLRTEVNWQIAGCTFAAILLCSPASGVQQPSDPLASERAELADNHFTQAADGLRNYLKAHADSADAHFLLGYVLFREQKAVDSLAEFTAGAKFRRPKADELMTVASDYVLLGDFADADKWFTEVTVETPNNSDAWYLLGRTKFNENAFASAQSSFERALALRPRYVEAENNLGLVFRETNDNAKAKDAFQTAIDWQGPSAKDAQPFLNLGTMLADERNFAQAMPNLERAAVLAPANPKVHEELASVYEAQKDLPKAQSELERAVEFSPQSSGLHFKLGQIYRREGLLDRARQEFALVEKLNSTHSSSTTPNPPKPDHSPLP